MRIVSNPQVMMGKPTIVGTRTRGDEIATMPGPVNAGAGAIRGH